MKTRTILLTLLVLAASLSAGEDAAHRVSGRFYNFPVSEVLKWHGRLSGKEITVPTELKDEKAGVTFTIEKLTKDEALRVIEQVLAAQARVEIVRAQDGALVARRIEPRK